MIPYINMTAETLVADFSGDGKCEFMRDFAHPLSMMVIADRLGVPSEMLPPHLSGGRMRLLSL